MVADFDIAPEATVRELRRSELFGGLAQRKARHTRLLRHVGDLLLAELPAPAAHQRIECIPVRDPVPLCRKSWITPPVGRAHYKQPCLPLVVIARRDRGEPVAG